MQDLLVVIPAMKKNAVIPDQLIKKLDGITLIQRAIDTTKKLTKNSNIIVLTDSEEISLISKRNGVDFYYDNKISLNSNNIIDISSKLTKELKQKNILIYRANSPLVNNEILAKAYQLFLEDESAVLISVRHENKRLLKKGEEISIYIDKDNYFEEVKSFVIFSKEKIQESNLKPFIVDDEKSIEIENYQDWWVCEKILQRKRIVFNVIGSIEIGMGHIYHSLALAHEITDHEVIFVCNEKYKIAVDKIASMDYKVISANNVEDVIIGLNPDMVINDVLNTEISYIFRLRECNIKIVNFEDLGEGSKYADIVFNELYDTPQLEGKNYYWGYKYLILRDEFYSAKSHEFINDIKEIIVTFGGTDQNNLTLISLKSILDSCKEKNIIINIVCGGAYKYKNDLKNYIDNCNYSRINLTYESGIISGIMEKSQLAISSNGRTVYELADMNIPSIIISHHEREHTHNFASLEKGFINLGVIKNSTEEEVRESFDKLIEDLDYRGLLFMNIKRYGFRKNKRKVVDKIMSLI
jgi:spore coat polysaccharide biosynthesis predicted glycosyltransferase SpsG/CMP-N-acetylneuraminic acid synthetase